MRLPCGIRSPKLITTWRKPCCALAILMRQSPSAGRPGQAPGYVLALNTLGAALGKVGLLDEAIAVLRQAIDLSHAYANAHHNLGNVLDRAGRVEEAKQAYHAALTINPTLEEARYILGPALGDMHPRPGLLMTPVTAYWRIAATILFRHPCDPHLRATMIEISGRLRHLERGHRGKLGCQRSGVAALSGSLPIAILLGSGSFSQIGDNRRSSRGLRFRRIDLRRSCGGRLPGNTRRVFPGTYDYVCNHRR